MKTFFTTITGFISGGSISALLYGVAAWAKADISTYQDFATRVFENPNWSPMHAILALFVLFTTWLGYNWDK